jgi:hypothetical protein
VAACNWLVLLSFPLSAAAAYLLARHLALSPGGCGGRGDPLFASNAFFDRRDLVQVKYEMLRQVDVEG